MTSRELTLLYEAAIRRVSRRRVRLLTILIVLAQWMIPPACAQQPPPSSQPSQKFPRARSPRRVAAYLLGGAGLFFGGVAVLNSADSYQPGDRTCVILAGCFTSTIRVTNRGRQASGAAMMAGAGVLAVLGFHEAYRKTFASVKPFEAGPYRRGFQASLPTGRQPGRLNP